MMKKFKVFSTLIIIALLAINTYGLNKHYIENRIKNVQEAIKKKKAGYLKLRAQYIRLTKQRRSVESNIKLLKKQIQHNQKGVIALNHKIELLKKDIFSISQQLVVQKKELYKELNEYYQYSMTSGYYKKGVWYEYMNSFIIKYMENKINQYVLRKTYLKNRLDTLKMYVDKKRLIVSQIRSQQNSLKSQVHSLSLLTKESLKKKHDYLVQIKKLNLEQDRLHSILQKIIEQERQRAMEEARQKAQERRMKQKKAKVISIKQRGTISSYTLRKSFGGILNPPVVGKVIDTFGKKYDTVFRVYTRNDGIDIKAPQGSCVRVVYRGKVDYVGSLPGYGGVIIINHLNGYYTVYGGVFPMVRVGEYVKTQRCIGKMQKNRLHFELRRHAKAINPLKLLNRRFLR